MSVTSQVAKSGPFLITALPQIINVGFPFDSGSEIMVINNGPASDPFLAPEVLALGSDYTVSGGGYNLANQLQLGSITVSATGINQVAINDLLVIVRNVPINQTDSFESTGPLTIKLLEQALDKQATISQQLQDQINGCLQFEKSEFLSGVLSKALRKGKYLAFDQTTGAPIFVSSVPSGDITTNILVVNVRDYGATGNGVTDDTVAINLAIAALPSSGGVLYFPAGRYLTTATIELGTKNNTTIRGDGWCSEIYTSTPSISLNIDPVNTGVLVRDLKISSAAVARNGLHLVVANGSGFRMFNCWLYNSGEFSIFVATSGTIPDVEDVQIIGNLVTDSWADGIHIGAARGCLVENNIVHDCDDDLISVACDVSSNANYFASDVLVNGNLIFNGGSRGILVEDVERVTVTGNTIYNTVQSGIWVSVYESPTYRNDLVSIKGNTVWNTATTSGRGAIICAYTDNITISQNTINTTSVILNGIFLCDVHDLTLEGNDLTNIGVHGIVSYSDTTTGPGDIGFMGRVFSLLWSNWSISNNRINGLVDVNGASFFIRAPSTANITDLTIGHNRSRGNTSANYIVYGQVTVGKICFNISLETKAISDAGGSTSVTVSNNA